MRGKSESALGKVVFLQPVCFCVLGLETKRVFLVVINEEDNGDFGPDKHGGVCINILPEVRLGRGRVFDGGRVLLLVADGHLLCYTVL